MIFVSTSRRSRMNVLQHFCKTALARLETLIQSEREAANSKRRKRGDKHRRLARATPVDSSLGESSPSSRHEADADLGEQTAESAQPEQPSGADPAQSAEAAPKAAAKSEAAPKSGATPTPSEGGHSRVLLNLGQHEVHASLESFIRHKSPLVLQKVITIEINAQCNTMQRMLGTLEPSHRKPKPIFPQSVLVTYSCPSLV